MPKGNYEGPSEQESIIGIKVLDANEWSTDARSLLEMLANMQTSELSVGDIIKFSADEISYFAQKYAYAQDREFDDDATLGGILEIERWLDGKGLSLGFVPSSISI